MRATALLLAALALLTQNSAIGNSQRGASPSDCKGAAQRTGDSKGPHSYFLALTSRADCLVAYSLRDQAEIDRYRRGRTQASAVTYDPATDKDPRKQDAAKILIVPPRINLPTQVRMPIPPAPDGFLITWDAWWGKEFAFSNTGIGQYKAFQLASGSRIWTEIRTVFKAAANPRNGQRGAIAMVDARSYGGRSGGFMGPNVTKNQPLQPQVERFAVMPETWTRYWVLLSPAADGFFEFSLWVADERRDPVRLHDKLLIKPTPTGTWNEFWLEYNTSSKKQVRETGELVSYVRNVVVLRGVKNATEFLKRP